MNWFWKRQVPSAEVEAVASELRKLQAAHRDLEREFVALHEDCRKWMRRSMREAQNVEKAEGKHQEPAQPRPEPETPSPRLTMWGARQRIAARRSRRGDPLLELEDADTEGSALNGVHP